MTRKRNLLPACDHWSWDPRRLGCVDLQSQLHDEVGRHCRVIIIAVILSAPRLFHRGKHASSYLFQSASTRFSRRAVVDEGKNPSYQIEGSIPYTRYVAGWRKRMREATSHQVEIVKLLTVSAHCGFFCVCTCCAPTTPSCAIARYIRYKVGWHSSQGQVEADSGGSGHTINLRHSRSRVVRSTLGNS